MILEFAWSWRRMPGHFPGCMQVRLLAVVRWGRGVEHCSRQKPRYILSPKFCQRYYLLEDTSKGKQTYSAAEDTCTKNGDWTVAVVSGGLPV